jgi:hypothetical protein
MNGALTTLGHPSQQFPGSPFCARSLISVA